MEKENQIVIEGVAINLNTKPEELMATGKFNKYEDDNLTILKAKEYFNAFGEKFSGVFYFGTDLINIELYPKLDIPSPGYPDSDFEKASWEVCRNIIENNFDNVSNKDNTISSIFKQGKVSTFLGFDDGKKLCVGGYLYLEIRG